jgi:hypothetical protein
MVGVPGERIIDLKSLATRRSSCGHDVGRGPLEEYNAIYKRQSLAVFIRMLPVYVSDVGVGLYQNRLNLGMGTSRCAFETCQYKSLHHRHHPAYDFRRRLVLLQLP